MSKGYRKNTHKLSKSRAHSKCLPWTWKRSASYTQNENTRGLSSFSHWNCITCICLRYTWGIPWWTVGNYNFHGYTGNYRYTPLNAPLFGPKSCPPQSWSARVPVLASASEEPFFASLLSRSQAKQRQVEWPNQTQDCTMIVRICKNNSRGDDGDDDDSDSR